MLKITKENIIIALTALLAAGSVTAAAGKAAALQYSGSLLQNADAEKLLYCETDYAYIEENNYA